MFLFQVYRFCTKYLFIMNWNLLVNIQMFSTMTLCHQIVQQYRNGKKEYHCEYLFLHLYHECKLDAEAPWQYTSSLMMSDIYKMSD